MQDKIIFNKVQNLSKTNSQIWEAVFYDFKTGNILHGSNNKRQGKIKAIRTELVPTHVNSNKIKFSIVSIAGMISQTNKVTIEMTDLQEGQFILNYASGFLLLFNYTIKKRDFLQSLFYFYQLY